ncbi:MAG TPA: phosphatase PAP2 family protein [Candidatus Thermoplasmatota archaeon]|nr:phosphatase PAP2 family protein [Candidatus Thermoplasmatota archaeon]
MPGNVLWDAFSRSFLDLNFLYYTMGAISIGGLLLATFVMRRSGTLDAHPRFARWVARVRSALPAVVVLSLTTLAAGMEGGVERAVQAWHQLDFTPLVWRVEGNLIERFQDAARTPARDYLLVTVYTVGAFLFYFVPFFTLVALGRGKNAMRIAGTMAIVWGVGIVFYLFVPVREVWMTADAPYHYTHVVNVLFERVPSAATSDAYDLATNNNFPSLHVALSCGIATALWLGGERWLAIPGTIVAGGVTVATMYLGIHWLSDVIAGLALAFAAAWIVHRRTAREPEAGAPWRR